MKQAYFHKNKIEKLRVNAIQALVYTIDQS